MEIEEFWIDAGGQVRSTAPVLKQRGKARRLMKKAWSEYGYVRIRWDETIVHAAYDQWAASPVSLCALIDQIRRIRRPLELERFDGRMWRSITFLSASHATKFVEDDISALVFEDHDAVAVTGAAYSERPAAAQSSQ